MSYRVSPKEQLLEKLGSYGAKVPEPIRRRWDALSTPKKWAAGVVLPVFAVYFLVFILPTMIPDFSRAPRPAPPTGSRRR